jgi:hypothetical protein
MANYLLLNEIVERSMTIFQNCSYSFASDLRHEPSPVHLHSFIWCKMIVDEPFINVCVDHYFHFIFTGTVYLESAYPK